MVSQASEVFSIGLPSGCHILERLACVRHPRCDLVDMLFYANPPCVGRSHPCTLAMICAPTSGEGPHLQFW